VAKPIVEPMMLRLVACGARRWSGGELGCWLRFCMNVRNLFSKSMLTLYSIFSPSNFLYLMRTSILRLQSFLSLRYLALSHDHEHNN
jgi:hypothetical protein